MKLNTLKPESIVALSMIAMLVTVTALARPGKQDFVLHNATGVEIHELYVSPHDSKDWEENILGRDTLPSGESLKITFNDREQNSNWDLRVVDGKGASIEWDDLNLVELSEVTLHFKDGKAWADIKK
jgi:hypothetical protein